MAAVSQYCYPFIFMPVVIDKVGFYLTRANELVEITKVSDKSDLNCVGTYYNENGQPNGTDNWNRSGRIFASITCDNDLIAFVQVESPGKLLSEFGAAMNSELS